jgi:L-cystine uptake protein TcyP (sodium:dicarboxylate symporter family)
MKIDENYKQIAIVGIILFTSTIMYFLGVFVGIKYEHDKQKIIHEYEQKKEWQLVECNVKDLNECIKQVDKGTIIKIQVIDDVAWLYYPKIKSGE